jgi:hypothetical protein
MNTNLVRYLMHGARALACILATTHLLGGLWFSDPSKSFIEEIYGFLPTAALFIGALVPGRTLRRWMMARAVVIILLVITMLQYADALLVSIGGAPHPFAVVVRSLVLVVSVILAMRAAILLSSREDKLA